MEDTHNTEKETTSHREKSRFAKVIQTIKVHVKKFWQEIRDYTHLREDTGYESTIESISNSVEFRGVNVWILAFAIIVASVGLNVNSTAVIIGAMLISPLMGPITGIGLSIGIVDEDLLRKSLRNLLIMVLISIITSTIYFVISPLSEAQSELLARTRPTTYDVLIAFFGGLAGIVATSRKSQQITVISGVAIATALMPPLCTAGYGLATWQPRFFGGALYLFFINSFFIALATFIMVRYLGFQQKKYLDSKRQKGVKRIIYIFALIVLIPSVFTAFNLIQETAFNTQVRKFVNEIQLNELFSNAQLIESQSSYAHKNQILTLRTIGKPFSNDEIKKLQDILKNDYGLNHAKLVIRQTSGTIDITQQNRIIEEILDKKDEQIRKRDSVIVNLENHINSIGGNSEVTQQIVQEVYVQYPNIKEFAISEMEFFDATTLNSVRKPVVYIKWQDNLQHTEIEKKIISWLKIRLKSDDIEIIRN